MYCFQHWIPTPRGAYAADNTPPAMPSARDLAFVNALTQVRLRLILVLERTMETAWKFMHAPSVPDQA
jgi:hypothetical protein